MSMNEHTFVFICGLHRSGTSTLSKCIREHPCISGFEDTGAPEDEGQHLQTVYPSAMVYGGPGQFGFSPQAHLTEKSPLVTSDNRRRILSEWSRLWDTKKDFLLEKSPPNLIRTRFLQAMFPKSYFIILMRHPIAVAYATQKMCSSNIPTLIKHWLVCHETFSRDENHLKHFVIVKYEDFVKEPERELNRIHSFLNVPAHNTRISVLANLNEGYFERWRMWQNGILSRWHRHILTLRFEKRLNQFGYSLRDLS